MSESIQEQDLWDSLLANKCKYISLGTLKKDGSVVRTPVWYVSTDPASVGSEIVGSELVVTTEDNSGKVKRIRNFPDVEIAECDMRGRIKGKTISVVAQIVDPASDNGLLALFHKKYGLMFRIMSLRGRKSGQRVFIRISQPETHRPMSPQATHE
jgi:PPOX class probable F420-dependent enzyme